MLVLLSLSTALAQNSTHCTATNDSGLVYQAWSKSGGAHPGPSTPMSGETWMLDEVVIHTTTVPYMDAPIVQGTLVWTWDEPAKPPPGPDRGAMMSEWSYVTRVTVWTSDETPLAEGAPVRMDSVRMKCTAQAYYGIP